MTKEVEFVRLVGQERRVGDSLSSISRHWKGDGQRFLFVSPHDDDGVIGAGLLMQLALKEGIPVHILIVTDGSMGYCSMEEKESISKIRRKETFEAYESLGVARENIYWLGYPDCQLKAYCGRRLATEDTQRISLGGYVGLQNTFTYYLRKVRPTQCFLPTSQDYHPDHRIVHEEFLISMFHASGAIWPELGTPLEKVPYIHEFAVYCAFSGPPTLRIKTALSYMDKKIKAVAAFQSQKQIAESLENLRASGPQEYIQALKYKLYDPVLYYNLFEEKT